MVQALGYQTQTKIIKVQKYADNTVISKSGQTYKIHDNFMQRRGEFEQGVSYECEVRKYAYVSIFTALKRSKRHTDPIYAIVSCK